MDNSSKHEEATGKKYWRLSEKRLTDEFSVEPQEGLTEKEATEARKKYGPNSLKEIKKASAWVILIDQFKSLVVLLLVAAAGFSFLFHEWLEGFAIVTVIVINAAIGFVTELKAIRSMEALRKLGAVVTRVRRDGNSLMVAAEELVPGDIVLLEGGDVVTADMRILYSSRLEADESTLTGESLPVSKNEEVIDQEKVPIAERSNMLFKGTAITRGSAEAIVVSTGMNTELGHISSLVESASDEITPLEKRLNKLAHRLIFLVLVIAALVIGAGLIRGKDLFIMVETGIALAVASIPEGLPIVATIALARGMLRMAKRQALINRLSAVETLGATNVIFTDKTGTLTQNRMTAVQAMLPEGPVEIKENITKGDNAFFKDDRPYSPKDHPVLRKFLEIGVLCNNASLEEGKIIAGGASGDPLEVAILVAGAKAGIHRDELYDRMPEVAEEAFESSVKMMANYNKSDGRILVSVKGAPEAVLEHCAGIMTEGGEKPFDEEEKKKWISHNEKMARNGLRIIALAYKYVDSEQKKPYSDLILTGLIGLVDPPREDVAEALNLCKKAGINVIMVTGDQPITAAMVAKQTNLTGEEEPKVIHGKDLKPPEDLTKEEKRNLLDSRIFARVSPEQKLDLVGLHREQGAVAAMTGDGVNDAPALKKANIGIAMGKRGTQVACEAADMILKDDSFSSIVAAVEEGRVIFGNIRKSIFYLLSCNVSEILVIFFASLFMKDLPLLPLQILFLNFVTDVFPALALGVGKGNPRIMNQPPRDPKESIITSGHWKGIFGYGTVITISVLGAYLTSHYLLKLDPVDSNDISLSVSFLTIALAQIFHVFNMRDKGSNFLKNEVTENLFVWGGVVLCILLLLIAVYLPVLANILKVTPPGIKGWFLILCASLIPFIIGQALKHISTGKK